VNVLSQLQKDFFLQKKTCSEHEDRLTTSSGDFLQHKVHSK